MLSQPSLPFPVSAARKRDLGLSDSDLRRVQERAAAGTCVLGLRFSGDTFSPPERFDHLREALGDRFVAVELDSSAGNPHGHKPKAHSVLTDDLDDRPGNADPGRPRPGARLLRRAAVAVNRLADRGSSVGRHRHLAGHDVFTIEVPARGQERREPLLVLHGFPTSSFDFHLVVDSMADHRRVLLFDMVGYGLSYKPDLAYTMDLQADVVMAYTGELGIGPAGSAHPRHGRHRRG